MKHVLQIINWIDFRLVRERNTVHFSYQDLSTLHVTPCVFCNKRFLLACAAKDGCCGSCTVKTIHDIDTKKMSVSAHIKTTITQLKSDIAGICTGGGVIVSYPQRLC